jgi:glycosyltransferase involved in cell wall biosynthesis
MQMQEPLVSIICTTYNHGSFIRQCLDGFMMQKTNFTFEVLIHDDASTDNTADIIREYEDKYPDIIKPIYQTENQYQKGVKIGITYLYPRAKGKYIAECEGDDYWTDPLKLQKQVDFLEKHSEYVMCSHMCDRFCDTTGEFVRKISDNDVNYSLPEFLKGEWYYQTLSVLFRRDALDLNNFLKYKICTDLVLFYELLRFGGKGIMLKDNMGVYRWHTGGIWSMIGMDSMRAQEFKVRFAIYEVVPNKDSAALLLQVWRKPISRRWLISHPSVSINSFAIFTKYLGVFETIKLLFGKIFLAKDIKLKQ